VSGQIAAISVDFNDKVKRASFSPDRSHPAATGGGQRPGGRGEGTGATPQTQLEYQRSKTLRREDHHRLEHNTAKSNYEVAKADLTSAQVALDQARQNLHTNISPIDGVVVDRNVDIGQTVAEPEPRSSS
jgi:HlyD family secretion protein